jgi:hypothetical protein
LPWIGKTWGDGKEGIVDKSTHPRFVIEVAFVFDPAVFILHIQMTSIVFVTYVQRTDRRGFCPKEGKYLTYVSMEQCPILIAVIVQQSKGTLEELARGYPY